MTKYEYTAIVKSVYDGDTITVDIDLGFNTWMKKQKIRLYRINTPEVRGPERQQGLISRDWLRKQILGETIILKTHRDKTGKYGRWLADIWIKGKCMNDELVTNGLAKFHDY